jgi:hypothetical protein
MVMFLPSCVFFPMTLRVKVKALADAFADAPAEHIGLQEVDESLVRIPQSSLQVIKAQVATQLSEEVVAGCGRQAQAPAITREGGSCCLHPASIVRGSHFNTL